MKLSAIIIAKNSESVIGDALRSLQFADEIIVVDGGSTDKTREIAKTYKAKIVKGVTNNFAEQRNIGLKEAKGEWVFYIDSDERVSEELKKNVQYQISNIKYPIQYSAYKIKRKNFYFGNHFWPQIEHLERLFKKDQLKEWYGRLHESPKVDGDVGELDGFLYHYTHSNLSSMLQKTIVWSETEAMLRLESHHPKMSWWRFPRVMITVFYDSYIKQQGWKAGTAGLIESMYQSFSTFITYARLWEMQTKHE